MYGRLSGMPLDVTAAVGRRLRSEQPEHAVWAVMAADLTSATASGALPGLCQLYSWLVKSIVGLEGVLPLLCGKLAALAQAAYNVLGCSDSQEQLDVLQVGLEVMPSLLRGGRAASSSLTTVILHSIYSSAWHADLPALTTVLMARLPVIIELLVGCNWCSSHLQLRIASMRWPRPLTGCT